MATKRSFSFRRVVAGSPMPISLMSSSCSKRSRTVSQHDQSTTAFTSSTHHSVERRASPEGRAQSSKARRSVHALADDTMVQIVQHIPRERQVVSPTVLAQSNDVLPPGAYLLLRDGAAGARLNVFVGDLVHAALGGAFSDADTVNGLLRSSGPPDTRSPSSGKNHS